jgi:hypothetical protein
MYLEFALDEIYYPTLVHELTRWSQKHSVEYHVKVVKNKAKITFKNPEFYTSFCLSWNPKSIHYEKYKLIEPMKVDNKT